MFLVVPSTRVFHTSLKGISRKFQRWLSQFLGVLTRKLKGVLSASMMFYDCFTPYQVGVSESLIRRGEGGGEMAVLAIFFYSK